MSLRPFSPSLDLPLVKELIANINQQDPSAFCRLIDREDHILILSFGGYYCKPTDRQIDLVKKYFFGTEVVEMDDEDCGVLYPVYCKL